MQLRNNYYNSVPSKSKSALKNKSPAVTYSVSAGRANTSGTQKPHQEISGPGLCSGDVNLGILH